MIFKVKGNVLQAKGGDGMMDHIYSLCSQYNAKFEDTSFPHDQSSLVEHWEKDNCAFDDVSRDDWTQIVWKRATDIPELNKDGKLAIFYEGIEPNDVQ